MAVSFPWLPAERLIRARIAPPDTPFALVEKQRGAMRIIAVNPAAHALGMTRGLALADARARVPDLPAYDANPAADADLLDRLAESCLRYTPRVMADPPQGLILDISGCHHLFDSNMSRAEKYLANDLTRRLGAAGLTAQLAYAPSADAAMALANYGLNEGAVAHLPVSALRCPASVHHALQRAGLTHIGDLASRPRTVLAARFGEDMTRLLARLLNEEDTPLIPRRTPPAIRCEARFVEPIGHIESVREVMATLADEAIVQLGERGLGARAVEVMLFRCDGQIRTLIVETAAPTRDPALIMRLFAERIETLNDPLDPGFGYDQIVLAVTVAEPQSADQRDFTGSATKAREELAALLARLSTRLGPERVTRWQAVDSHVPERVFVDGTIATVAAQKFVAPANDGNLNDAIARPLLLLDPPQQIEAIAEVPDGPPYRFRWRGSQHRVARHEGPERIAMPWWDGARKEARLTRDYYRVEDIEGRRFWLFRHGLYSEKADPVWYMHGLFA